MRTIHTLLLLVGLGLALPGTAQWQWRDHNNKLVFSDRPPPGDIADKDILKRPGRPSAGASAVAPAPAPATAGAEAPPRPSGKDKELEERRKQAEQQEADKKRAEDEARAKARADNCARARQAKGAYDSGVRIARLDAKGEREFLDDATRAADTRRLQGIIASDCQ